MRKRAEQAETGRQTAIAKIEEVKDRAAQSERRSRQEAADMEQEMIKAQEMWKERIGLAEKRASDLLAQLQTAEAQHNSFKDEVRREMEKQRAKYETICRREAEARKAAEVGKEKAEAHASSLLERARAEADAEFRARRELADGETLRQELQDRLSEQAQQLERAQAAYGDAAAEIGVLSAKLYELEFGQSVDRHTEDALRTELAYVKDKLREAERRVDEVSCLRDYAQKQAEDSRAASETMKSELEVLRSESSTTRAAAQAAEELRSLQENMDFLVKRHQETLKEVALQHKDQVDYLRKKCDEKDRRVEELTSERNTLRLETRERQASPSMSPSQKESLDIEEGGGKGPKTITLVGGANSSSWTVCISDGDHVLKRFSRVLHASSAARTLFFGYVCILHIWILVVLHKAAAAHALQGPS